MLKNKRVIIFVLLALAFAANAVTPFRVKNVAVHIRAEPIFRIGSLAISNALIGSWIGGILLVALAWATTRKLVDTPAAVSLQNAIEAIFEALLNFMERFVGARATTFFPLIGSLFLYILICNWISMVPGFGSIGLWETHHGERVFIPLLKGPDTDLNSTIALAICSVLGTQYYVIRQSGWLEFASRYIGVKKFVLFFAAIARRQKPDLGLLAGGILDVYMGMLEILEELTKVLSFSFRLFGNMFAGEVLLTVIAFLAPYAASLPFMGLEMFTGFIQALIFAALSTAFVGRATLHGQHEQPAHALRMHV